MKEKKVNRMFQNQNGQLNGILTAGNSSMTDVLLWALLVLPAWIGKNGAGVCVIDVGIFIGTTFAWLFLVKRLRAYRDVSKKEIFHIWDYMYERFQSTVTEKLFLGVWLLLSILLAGAVIKLGSRTISGIFGIGEQMTAVCILVCLVLMQFVLQPKGKAIVRTFFYSVLFVLFIFFIVLVFLSDTPRGLLDIYGKIHLPGGTSSYLNILYCNGEQTELIDLISMLGMGAGCLGLPFLFEGAFEAKDVRELDRGRILSILYSGGTVVAICIWSLLNIACIFPEKIQTDDRTDELINSFMRALLQKSGWADDLRYVALILYVIAILCMAEQMTEMAVSAAHGMVQKKKKTRTPRAHIWFSVGSIICVMALLTVAVIFLNVSWEKMILIAWEYASAVAAPCVIAIICRTASKAGVLGGLLSGLLCCSFWYFIPVIDGGTLADTTGLNAGTASFVFGMAITLIVSMFTHKTNEAEKRLFEQMKLEQR